MPNLKARNQARRAELTEQINTARAELNRLDALKALLPATQYAIDFANPGEAVISREELEHDITEDIGVLEAEDGQASRMIDEAIAAGELEDGGRNEELEYRRLLIPYRTWRRAGFNC